VLADNDLGELFAAIRQGRTIRENLGKAIHFLLATNLSEMLLAAGGVAVAGTCPLNPRHLLWINLLTDVVPALALALDPPDPGIMDEPPQDPDRPLFSTGEWGRMGWSATCMAAGAAVTHRVVGSRSPRSASTAAFMSLSLSQLLYTSTARMSARGPGAEPNPLVTSTVAAGAALQVLTLFVPPLRALLGNVRLNTRELATASAGALIPFFLTRIRSPRC
jgi:P-type Ca2+ transporter type 2C